ncbi:MAG: hypothetical protein V3S51_02065 [Dehalococcoidia bacterium]
MTKKTDLRQKEDFNPSDMVKLDRKGHNAALQRFFHALGEDDMVQALHHSADPRVVLLLEFMFDPKHRDSSFTKLCKECGLHLGDIVDVFRRYKLDLGIIAMAKAAPRIMADTAEDAKSQKALCMTCMGVGEVIQQSSDPDGEDEASTCPNCVGIGTFKVPGHDKSRELFYKTMGLTKSAPLIAQQINVSSSNAPPSVEEFVLENQKAEKESK